MRLKFIAIALVISMALGINPKFTPALFGKQALAIAQAEAKPTLEMVSDAAKHRVQKAYANASMNFIENAGQATPKVRYYAQGSGYRLCFTKDEVQLGLSKNNKVPNGVWLALKFVGANPKATLCGRHKAKTKVNYLVGSDPAKWKTELPAHKEIVYHNLWPGIDMIFKGDNGQLKYEFVLKPGANVNDIRLSYRGADSLSLDNKGNLLIKTPLGILTDDKPVCYQKIDGKQVPVKSRFVLQCRKSKTSFGFEVAKSYDPRYPLIIDPGLIYSTYLGGSGLDPGNTIAVDATGNTYVAGNTDSPDFPTISGALDESLDGGAARNRDAFVAKLDADGSIIYSTYLGGSNSDSGNAITVDAKGNIYVAGDTSSTDFSTTGEAFDTSLDGDIDGFVAKLSPDGTRLLYSTYLGGNHLEFARGIAIDAEGNAHVTGLAKSNNFPTTLGAYDQTISADGDVFVAKLNQEGTDLIYATLLGGSGLGEMAESAGDFGTSVAVDGNGNTYVTGQTTSADFPTTIGAIDRTLNGGDAFVAKLNTTGSSLVYGTYLGGSRFENGSGIAVDAGGSTYVTGLTASDDFPTTPGAFDRTPSGAFVTKLNPSGTGLIYSTYLGGSGGDSGNAIALDAVGNTYVAGYTGSADFPTTPNAYDRTPAGSIDAFVAKLDSTGSGLIYSTYLGGNAGDVCLGIAVDSRDNAYVTGATDSTNFPTIPGAFDRSFNGNGDAFVIKLDVRPLQEHINDFIDAVHALVAAGTLNQANGDSLIAKLQAVITQLDQNNFRLATDRLKEFINELKIFINEKVLTQAQGQPLIDAAESIVLSIKEPTFPDIPETHFVFDAVELLEVRGIIQGYPNETFRPDVPITRAEFIKIASLAAGIGAFVADPPVFPDIGGHWAKDNITGMWDAQVVNGYPDGTFRPNAPITRAEIAKIVVKARGFTIDTRGAGFSDVPTDHWAHDFILTAANNDIIQGFPDGTFHPNANATRAEAAQMVFNWQVN